MAAGRSWHIPTIFKYNAPTADQVTNVVFLQRMTDTDRRQVEDALNATDPSATERLDIPPGIQTRQLQCKKWIRDYFPPSSAILEIATNARDYHSTGMRTDPSYCTFIFVDSGWEVGNVMAAHWEPQGGGEEGEERLAAVRVPMGIANLLLTACDGVEGMTLAHSLGQEAYEKAKVDFYKDLPDPEESSRTGKQDEEVPWPKHLPKDMALNRQKPTIISLRQLDEDQIERLKGDINADEEEAEEIEILNWQGPEPSDRLIIRDLFNHMQRNTPSGEKMNHAFFIDYMLRDENDEPQILAVCPIKRDEGKGVVVMPVFTPEFLLAWEKASEGQEMDQKGEIVDIWKVENVDHLNAGCVAPITSACPIFFLHPFTAAEERRVRAAITALSDVDEGEDWGHLFQWYGYIFPDAGETHALDDLRDLFQRCDPGSPFFDRTTERPYTLKGGYLTNFIAVDEKVLDADKPRVWIVSSMDFAPEEDLSDDLGWTAGRIRPEQSSIVFVNLDIANMGLDESVEDEATLRRVWLGDLQAFREEDWEENLIGQGGEEEEEGGAEESDDEED